MIRDFFKVKTLSYELGITACIGVFISFMSPFGMVDTPFLLSASYWVVTCLVGYCIYKPSFVIGSAFLQTYIKHSILRMLAIGLFASIVMSLIVPILIWAFFSVKVDYLHQFLIIFPKVILIASILIAVMLVKEHIKQQKQLIANSEHITHSEQDDQQAQLQQFMTHLPIEKRGKLICLEMSDHYLKVYTEHGHHLILMRFKDAMQMLADVKGLQTHRSWWVANTSIIKTLKIGRKLVLVMENDVQVPVSKTYLDNVNALNL